MLPHRNFVDNCCFLKMNKSIVSKWHQNLDDKLIREYIESVLQFLNSRLTYHRNYLQQKDPICKT